MADKKEMHWFVFIDNINNSKIEVFDIFLHTRFDNDVKKLLKDKKIVNKEEFSKKLENELMYYYWSKCEWEVIISPWIGKKDDDSGSIKVDVYEQVKLNWNIFVDYVYGFKKENKHEEKRTYRKEN